MSIRIVPATKRLTEAAQTVYVAPGDVISSTVATGLITNNAVSQVSAKVWLRVTGRNSILLNGTSISFRNGPFQLPPTTLAAGETIEMWSDIPNALDVNLSIGEQR